MSSKPVRTILTVIMDILIVIAIALTARMVVAFFGTLAATQWGEVILMITDRLVLPLGIEPIKTPYGGVFDVAAAITIGLLLVAEWILSTARSRQ